MNDSLSEALTGTETVVDAPAPVASDEQTDSTDQSAADSSLIANESAEEQAKPEETPKDDAAKPEAKAEAEPSQGEKHLREWGNGLETDLKALQGKIAEVGGEGHLQIMAPVLAKAQELPGDGPGLEMWSKEMFSALEGSLVPAQVKALRDEAAWSYLLDPGSAKVIAESLYGDGTTPDLLRDLVQAFKVDPTILDVLRPEETVEQREARQASEARERARDEEIKTIKAEGEKRDADALKVETQRTMTGVFQVALAPRAEIKKQYGLEFQASDKDTPEIASFKERQSNRYDRLVVLALQADSEMNRLSNAAEYLAGQKDERQRQRANAQFGPQLEQRTRTICAQVAKDLAADLKLLSPEFSDRTKAQNLKDLPAQVLGSTASTGATSGFDLTDMPDPTRDPRGHAAWVSKMIAADAAQRRTPPILQAG